MSTWLFQAAGHSFLGGSPVLEGAGGERNMGPEGSYKKKDNY